MCLFLAKRGKSRIQGGYFSYKCHMSLKTPKPNTYVLQPIKLMIASPVCASINRGKTGLYTSLYTFLPLPSS